jgi:hypothetical protein
VVTSCSGEILLVSEAAVGKAGVRDVGGVYITCTAARSASDNVDKSEHEVRMSY